MQQLSNTASMHKLGFSICLLVC